MNSQNDPFDVHHRQPLLVVISGLSGAGKDTVLRRMEDRRLPFHFVVTATSRSRRENEVQGRDYFFYSPEEFQHMIDHGELLEYAVVYGQYKGIPKEQVRSAFASGKDVIMRIDVQGAAAIRSFCPEAVLIFLTTQSEAEMVERLKSRGDDSPEEINLRVTTARQELARLGEFDYVVVNANSRLDQTVDIIEAIIQAEHQRIPHRKVSL